MLKGTWRSGPPMSDLKIVETKDLTFRARSSTSKYATLVEAAAELEPGQSIPLELPEELRAEFGPVEGLKTFRNRVAAVIHRSASPNASGRLTVRILDGKGIAICCLPKKAEAAPAKPVAAKKKAKAPPKKRAKRTTRKKK